MLEGRKNRIVNFTKRHEGMLALKFLIFNEKSAVTMIDAAHIVLASLMKLVISQKSRGYHGGRTLPLVDSSVDI